MKILMDVMTALIVAVMLLGIAALAKFFICYLVGV